MSQEEEHVRKEILGRENFAEPVTANVFVLNRNRSHRVFFFKADTTTKAAWSAVMPTKIARPGLVHLPAHADTRKPSGESCSGGRRKSIPACRPGRR